MNISQFIHGKILTVKHLIYLFTLTEFDTSTNEGRSNERYRRSLITTVATVFSKFFSFVIFAVSIPLTISYLGKEQFGLWMTLSSIILMLNIFSDLGLGIALMNKTSESVGSNRKDLVKSYVSNTFFLLISVSVLIVSLYVFPFFFSNWSVVFKLKELASQNEIDLSMGLLVLIFSINLPFSVIDRFQDGNQQGYLNSMWQSIGNVMALFGLILIVKLKLGLPYLIVTSFGIPTLSRIVNFIIQFFYKNSWARPSFSQIDKSVMKSLLHVGFVFFVLNFFNVLGVHSDNIIISTTMGASEVALYSIVQKLSMTAFIFWSFTNSLWPAYSEALSRQDYVWVRKTLKSNLLMSLFFGLLIAIIVVAFGKIIVFYLTKGTIEPSFSLLIGFGGYIFILGLIGSFATIFNASFLYKKQIKYFILASLVSLLLKFLLGISFGVIGVIWATTIGYGIFYIIPSCFIIKNTFWTTKLNLA